MAGFADRRGFSLKVLGLRTRNYGSQIQGRKEYTPGAEKHLDRLKRQPIVSAAAFFVLWLLQEEITP